MNGLELDLLFVLFMLLSSIIPKKLSAILWLYYYTAAQPCIGFICGGFLSKFIAISRIYSPYILKNYKCLSYGLVIQKLKRATLAIIADFTNLPAFIVQKFFTLGQSFCSLKIFTWRIRSKVSEIEYLFNTSLLLFFAYFQSRPRLLSVCIRSIHTSLSKL